MISITDGLSIRNCRNHTIGSHAVCDCFCTSFVKRKLFAQREAFVSKIPVNSILMTDLCAFAALDTFVIPYTEHIHFAMHSASAAIYTMSRIYPNAKQGQL